MPVMMALRQPGVAAALGAALLFGASTPLAKRLLAGIDPALLAGLLYLGAGLGLALYRRGVRCLTQRPTPLQPVRLPRDERGALAGAILAGGIVAPLLLMTGLAAMPASGAALLLNAESVFTALLAWFAFKENVDRRVALGMLAIVAGAALLGWPGEAHFADGWPTLAVLGACLAWGIDNNLTRRISLNDASWIASIKGLVAGSVNLVLALAFGASMPSVPLLAGALLVGLLAYGISLTLFVVGLRHLGTARTGAYFSVAPFFGAVLAVLMGEPLTPTLLAAAVLMALGTWLHLTERHRHVHTHEAIAHTHRHRHDAHHQHPHHPPLTDPDAPHAHAHVHAPLRHSHAHYPDSHHRHAH